MSGEFAKHEITRLGPRSWKCKEPGTSTHWFGVMLGPCCVVVHGDIGDLMLCPYAADPLGWVLDVCGEKRSKYPDYPLGKAPGSMTVKEFSPDYAREWIAEMKADPEAYGDVPTKIESVLDGETEHDWYEACSFADDDEPANCRVWTREALWCFEGLCWWAANVDLEQEVAP